MQETTARAERWCGVETNGIEGVVLKAQAEIE
jgi:hypothetical protein